MGLRPATPGFLVTLLATILLAVVSFNVPLLKSVYFLKASLTVDNISGTITLGTLGYCLELSTNGTTCTSPKVGYSFDPNSLLGDNSSIQIPTVFVKWITYALFLHVIALCAAAVSALFGLLAHVREMSMTCCSTFISGIAAVITLVAFIFDIVLFFVVKERIKSIDGTATFGSAVWLTLAAWLLLFFSGCVYACGRCCARRRSRGFGNNNVGNENNFSEQLRLDAVKAEADRKARQKNEVGLPAFPEYDSTKPLNSTKPQYLEEESDEEGAYPYRDQAGGQAYSGGYAQAPPGTRAVDEYYSPTRTEANTVYPPNRQYPANTSRSPPQSSYSQSVHSSPALAAVTAVTAGGADTTAYLAAGGHARYPTGRNYGHANDGTTYHEAASSQHQQYPSTYAQYDDPYAQQAQLQSTFHADSYNQAGAIAAPYGGTSAAPPPGQPTQQYATGASSSQYYTPAQGSTSGQAAYGDYYGYGSGARQQPERSYTLGGGGYVGNVVPGAAHISPPPMPTPLDTNVIAHQTVASPGPMGSPGATAYGDGGGVAGHAYTGPSEPQAQQYQDSPPVYEGPGPSVQVAEWGAKGRGFHETSR